MRRILLVLATAALLAAMVAASAVPAVAQVDLDGDGVVDDSSIFDDATDDEEEATDGDAIEDVDVWDAYLDGNDICVPVVITYEDGSTDEEHVCANASEFLA